MGKDGVTGVRIMEQSRHNSAVIYMENSYKLLNIFKRIRHIWNETIRQ